MFKLKLRNVQIEYDKNYGCHNRSGWTIKENGCVIVELQRFLIVCIIKWLLYRKDFNS